MTPAARHAATHLTRRPAASPLQGTTMRPEEVQAVADKLTRAIVDDDEDAGTTAAIQLVAGIAVNIARIADALTKPG